MFAGKTYCFEEIRMIITNVLQVKYYEERLDIFGGMLDDAEHDATQKFIDDASERFKELLAYLYKTHGSDTAKIIERLGDNSRFEEIKSQLFREIFPGSFLSAIIDAYIGFCAGIERCNVESIKQKGDLSQKFVEHVRGLAEQGSLKNIVAVLQWGMEDKNFPLGELYFANFRAFMLARRDTLNILARRQLLKEKMEDFEAFLGTLRLRGINGL